jgi:transcriptional regulator with XRE-family HTH domain
MLAGVSADYYVRLEQGRDQHPSEQVLDALADALGLDAAATAHLHSLAHPRTRRRKRATERVPAGILQLLPQLPMPAYVTGRLLDVLAANAMAIALSPMFTPGRNVLRELLLDPAAVDMHADWERATRSLVGHLRERADPDDPQLAALVGELSLRSDHFRRLWARADVGHAKPVARHLIHPQVGDLHLRLEKLDLDRTDGLQLVIQHAEPGSESAQALALLGSMSVTL